MSGPSALDAATDLTHAITRDPARSRRQSTTLVVAAVLMALFGAGFLVLSFVPDSWGLVFVAAFFALAAVVAVRRVIDLRRNPMLRALGVSPRGIFLPHLPDPVPWSEIASLSAVRYGNASSVGAGGAAASSALASRGVNDGGRDLNIVLKDAPAWRARLGSTFRTRVASLAWEDADVAGFNIVLSQVADARVFEALAVTLKGEADARGIPMFFRTF